jgi:hypothetical protein
MSGILRCTSSSHLSVRASIVVRSHINQEINDIDADLFDYELLVTTPCSRSSFSKAASQRIEFSGAAERHPLQ